MRTTIDGTLCDTDTSKLIARRERKGSVTGEFFDETTELYRTVLGRFFVREEASGFETADLLRKTEAMDLYASLPDKRLEFDDAFED